MNIKEKVASLKAAKEIIKRDKKRDKIGYDRVLTPVVVSQEDNDSKKTWYEIDIEIVDRIDEDVYRKTHNKYKTPFSPDNLGPRDLMNRCSDYLVDSIVTYVDKNNKIINYEESKKL